jgi:hypothetical protein
MHITEPISYNGRVAREIKMFVEMIEEVYSLYEVKWSNNSHVEIGFIYRNKSKRTNYFFGIWYDLWEQYGIPLCITLDYSGKAPNQWHDKVKKFVTENYNEGVLLKDYHGYTCILFEYSFFKFDKGDDIGNLSSLYDEVTKYAEEQATM